MSNIEFRKEQVNDLLRVIHNVMDVLDNIKEDHPDDLELIDEMEWIETFCVDVYGVLTALMGGLMMCDDLILKWRGDHTHYFSDIDKTASQNDIFNKCADDLYKVLHGSQ